MKNWFSRLPWQRRQEVPAAAPPADVAISPVAAPVATAVAPAAPVSEEQASTPSVSMPGPRSQGRFVPLTQIAEGLLSDADIRDQAVYYALAGTTSEAATAHLGAHVQAHYSREAARWDQAKEAHALAQTKAEAAARRMEEARARLEALPQALGQTRQPFVGLLMSLLPVLASVGLVIFQVEAICQKDPDMQPWRWWLHFGVIGAYIFGCYNLFDRRSMLYRSEQETTWREWLEDVLIPVVISLALFLLSLDALPIKTSLAFLLLQTALMLYGGKAAWGYLTRFFQERGRLAAERAAIRQHQALLDKAESEYQQSQTALQQAREALQGLTPPQVVELRQQEAIHLFMAEFEFARKAIGQLPEADQARLREQQWHEQDVFSHIS